jgi:hypothetical protein
MIGARHPRASPVNEGISTLPGAGVVGRADVEAEETLIGGR